MKWKLAIFISIIGMVAMIANATAAPTVVWRPQPGSQAHFMSCPVFECLFHGTRGPGKTDALLMDYAQFVGKGFGSAWRGVLFRQEYPDLEDVIEKGLKWFPRIFPGAKYNDGKHKWRFPTGEILLFRHARREADYWKYHGHEYPWVAWEELTNWADDKLYLKMMSVCRSSKSGIPRHYRATCNPYGPGHNWVKARFIDEAPPGVIIKGENGLERCHLFGSIYENKILMKSDPDYIRTLENGTEAQKRAWLHGDWDIVAGGVFDDVWDRDVHVIEPFAIPSTWRVNRSFDWGSARPYSVGWWAESDGSDIKLNDGTTHSTKRGDLFRIAELYGWNGKPNEGTRELATEVARKIVKAEKGMGYRVSPGPADTSIYDVNNGNCIADDMSRIGVRWTTADKRPGSRANGLEKLRERLKNTITGDGPGLFIFSTCRQFIRTVPVLPQDTNKPEDVDTNAEDHVYDECRYRVLAKTHSFTTDTNF